MFNTTIRISNTDNAEMLLTIVDLKDNYPNRNYVEGNSSTKEIQASLFEADYNSFVITLQALITEYDDDETTGRLKWSFNYQELP